MKTPSAFHKAVCNNVITAEILGTCIYSVNKRAKNYRDRAKTYRNPTYKASALEKCREFYQMKDKFLSILHPTEVHMEYQDRRDANGNLIPRMQYYNLYQVGTYRFHHPIDEEQADPALPKKMLTNFQTSGKAQTELISVQFCREVLELIQNGCYSYIDE